MIVTANTSRQEFVVIHPLFDEPEVKMTGEELGLMPMSPAVRFSLFLLRGYLIFMAGLLGYHLLDLAGAFSRHITK